MPVGYLIRKSPPASEQLKERLAAEWSNVVLPATNQNRPILIEDRQRLDFVTGQAPVHLYVIWEDWSALKQRDRSDIIMDAYSETHSQDDLLYVTLAMGLTPEEAQRMGIEYALAPTVPA